MARFSRVGSFGVHLSAKTARVDRDRLAHGSWRRLVELANELGRIDWEHLIRRGNLLSGENRGISGAGATKAMKLRYSFCWTVTTIPWES